MKFNFLMAGMIAWTGLCKISAAAELPPAHENLFPYNSFMPIMIDGEAVAAKGWTMKDYGRIALCRTSREYINGRQCFKLEFDGKGRMDVHIFEADKLPKGYAGKLMSFSPNGAWARTWFEPIVPAPAFRVYYEMKANRGKITLPGYRVISSSPDFQIMDHIVTKVGDTRQGGFVFTAEPGMCVSIRYASITPVYPKIGGSIRLPDGGKLSRIIIPADADFGLRLGALTWRGWLWKLTGTALPIETRKKAEPEKEAMLIQLGKTAPGGYILNIDRNGVTLTVGNGRDSFAAAFNYIRRHGVRLFTRDCQVIPKPDPDLTLVKLNETMVPRCEYLPFLRDSYLNGGVGGYELDSEINWYASETKGESHYWVNMLVPAYFYWKTHPEYYMFHDGKRQMFSSPYFMTLCVTNPDVKRIAAHRLVQYFQQSGSAESAGICQGDKPVFCQCPECAKLTHGESFTDALMSFMNTLETALLKSNPDGKKNVTFCAYHMYRFPPKEIKPVKGMKLAYCAQPRTMPCLVHIDCEINRRSNQNLAEWSRLMGKENVGIVHYEESRPYYDGQFLRFFEKYGSRDIYYHGYDNPRRYYIAGRWRFGDDPIKAQDEFFDGYYGKAAPFVRQVYRDLDEFCKNYKHTKEDYTKFCVSVLPVHTLAWKTILPREVFDKSYRLLEQALAAAGKDIMSRRHILYDKYRFLMADLSKYPRSSCRNREEMESFYLRLADFMRTLIELDELMAKNRLDGNQVRYGRKTLLITYADEQEFLLRVADMLIPKPVGKKKWFECKEIQDFLKNPKAMAEKTSTRTTFPGGMEWTAVDMFGGEGPQTIRSGHLVRVLRRPTSNQGVISVTFELAQAPKHACRLIIDGMDDEKPGHTTFKLVVNGKEVFSGPNTLSETGWSQMGVDIPEGALRKGKNQIDLVNTMEDRPEDKKKMPQVDIDLGDIYQINYWRGWLMLDKIRLLDLPGEFAKLTAGKESLWKCSVNPHFYNPKAVFEAVDGKLHLATNEKQVRAGVVTIAPRHYAVRPGEKLKISALVSGKGIFGLNYICYGPDGKYNRNSPRKDFKATAEEKWVVWETTIPEGTAFILPGMIVREGGDCRIADCKIETVKPQGAK